MTPDQEDALDRLRQKYDVSAVAQLPGGQTHVKADNAPTPYLFISEFGEVTDEDGFAVNV